MITNNLIHLNPKSKERIDAENFIKYTLLFDYDIPAANADSQNIVNEIMDKTQLCCGNLFSRDLNHIYYIFFGDGISYSENSKTKNINSLIYLNSFPVLEPIPEDLTYMPKDASLHSMIIQNCIMSAYHAILTEYQSSLSITSYTLVNDLMGGGIYTAFQKGAISCNNEGIKLSPKKLTNKNLNNLKKSSDASDFNKRFNARFESARPLMSFLRPNKDSHNEDKDQYLLQYATISNTLNNKDIKPAFLKQLSSAKDSKLNSNVIFSRLEHFIDTLTPRITSFHSNGAQNFSNFGRNIVDGVYHYYIAEKAYNFNLFYSILQNIKQIEEKHNYQLRAREVLETIFDSKKLPNPFSRTYFLRFAFDHILTQNNSYRDFWHFHDIDNRDIGMRSTRKMKTGFQFDKWCQQFQQFTNYMSEHIIPVYDWCFLTMLLNVIERSFPDENHTFHLKKAIDILGEYISKNYQKIMQPLAFNKKNLMDGVDIISSKNIANLESYFEKDIKLLFNTFFSSFDTELNLKPIIPQLYRGRGKYIERTSYNLIADFYYDLRFNYREDNE